MSSRKTVLITGCSEGGLGDALARAFHARGLRVIATARNPKKIEHLAALGLETAILDVLSTESIQACVRQVSKLTDGSGLDILVNNSGGGYNMPLADANIPQARQLFDLNVWSVLEVTQLFLPLLRQSTHNPVVVNNTSVAAMLAVPLQGIYCASKAATAMLSDVLRLELKPFNIKVVDLRTGAVQSKFFSNLDTQQNRLPQDSIYSVAKEEIEERLGEGGGIEVAKSAIPADTWAKQVVGDVLKESPPVFSFRGDKAWLLWFGKTFFPHTFFDGMLLKLGLMDLVERRLKGKQ